VSGRAWANGSKLGGRLALLAVVLVACGGRAARNDARDGAGATGGTSPGSGGVTATGGAGPTTGGAGPTTGGAGPAAGSPSVGNGGSGGSSAGEAGTAGTSVGFGDFDDPLESSVPGSSPSFVWGTPMDGHIGNWFVRSLTALTGDAKIDEITPPRGDSTKACHASGKAYAEGVDVYAQLNHPSNRPVDLGHYAGLTFWARLTGASSTLVVALNDGSYGLASDQDVLTGLPTGSFSAAEDWRKFELDFDPARSSSVVSLDFIVLGGGQELDLWIDDVTLLCRGECR
jgi:hypothetical protein